MLRSCRPWEYNASEPMVCRYLAHVYVGTFQMTANDQALDETCTKISLRPPGLLCRVFCVPYGQTRSTLSLRLGSHAEAALICDNTVEGGISLN